MIQLLAGLLAGFTAASPILTARSPPNAFTFHINCTAHDFVAITNGSQVCDKVISSFTTAGQILSTVFDIARPLNVSIYADKSTLAPGVMGANHLIDPRLYSSPLESSTLQFRALGKQLVSDATVYEDGEEDIRINLNVVDFQFYHGDDDRDAASNLYDLRWLALHEMMHGMGFGSNFRRNLASHNIFTEQPYLDDLNEYQKLHIMHQTSMDNLAVAVRPDNTIYSLKDKYKQMMDLLNAEGGSLHTQHDLDTFAALHNSTLDKNATMPYLMLQYSLSHTPAAQSLFESHFRNVTAGTEIYLVTAFKTVARLAMQDRHFNDHHGLDHLHPDYANSTDFLMQPYMSQNCLEQMIALRHNLAVKWHEGEPRPTNIDLGLAIGPITRQIMATIGWKVRDQSCPSV